MGRVTKCAVVAACLVAAALPADAGAQSTGPAIQGEFIATLALASVGQYPYCLGGGDIYGPTPGWSDPESDGSYSSCWDENHPNLPAKYGFDSTGLTRYVVYRGTGKQLTHDSFQAKFAGGDAVAGKAELLPGDVVYFDYNAGNGLDSIDRAGIYVGNGEVVSAVSEAFGILRKPIDWYEEERGLHYVGAVRFWTESRGPVGDADRISSPQIGQIRLGGWAVDPDAKTAPVSLYAYVGGYSFTPGAELHNLGPAAAERPDVAAADPDAGALHGIDTTFHTDKIGKQLVCLYATNIGEGSDSLPGLRLRFARRPEPHRRIFFDRLPVCQHDSDHWGGLRPRSYVGPGGRRLRRGRSRQSRIRGAGPGAHRRSGPRLRRSGLRLQLRDDEGRLGAGLRLRSQHGDRSRHPPRLQTSLRHTALRCTDAAADVACDGGARHRSPPPTATATTTVTVATIGEAKGLDESLRSYHTKSSK